MRNRLGIPKHGDMEDIMDHAEYNVVISGNVHRPETREKAARLADVVANVWCKDEEGYDDLDRQAYRAAYYHAIRVRRGW